jgi:hypothetical protein
MKTTLRFCFVLALALLLTAPVEAATRRSVAAPASLVSQAWSWLLQLTEKVGGCIDPNGATCASLAQSASDHGGCIDPNGALCAEAKSDAGGCIDPDGLHCANH